MNPRAYLETVGQTEDAAIDLAPAALALAALAQPETSLERYMHHLQSLAEKTARAHRALLLAGAADSVDTQWRALKEVLAEEEDYHGDQDTYDDLQNANLIRVIERRKGLPIALCILALHAGRAQGWDIAGLHFVCRLEKDGQRLIFDPFHDCDRLEAAGLRALIKKTAGPEAELSASYYEPAANREILIRLQNNIKYRQINAEDYAGALATVESMRLIDPEEYRLLLDAGVLYARTEQTRRAIDVLEDYIKIAPKDRDRHDAAMLLQDLKRLLN